MTTRLLENPIVYAAVCVLFALAVCLNILAGGSVPSFGANPALTGHPSSVEDAAAGAGGREVAHSPILPPDTWPEVAHSPILPPDTWPEVAHSPILPPDTWPEVAHSPILPPDTWPEVAHSPILPPDTWPEARQVSGAMTA